MTFFCIWDSINAFKKFKIDFCEAKVMYDQVYKIIIIYQ